MHNKLMGCDNTVLKVLVLFIYATNVWEPLMEKEKKKKKRAKVRPKDH